MDVVDIVHGLSGQSGHCPWTRQTGQCPQTKSTETDWTLSMDSLDFVQSDLVKKTEVKVASLEIYIQYIFK